LVTTGINDGFRYNKIMKTQELISKTGCSAQAMRGGENRPEHTHTEKYRAVQSSKESSLQLERTQQADAEDFILCGVVTATFRVLSLFVVTKCYSYSNSESVTTIVMTTCWEYQIN
jgi:hypothetical protein